MDTLDELMGVFASTKPATAIEAAFKYEEKESKNDSLAILEREKSDLRSTKKISLN